jgi:tRNA(Ile)-lysidine synthase
MAWSGSRADEALTRNFVRRRIGPLLDERFPGWKRALGRAARHFASRELRAQDLLREFLRRKGLKAPSEAKLLEMLRQLASGGARTSIEHDGARLRTYRGQLFLEARKDEPAFRPLTWRGEARLPIPALGGELRFRRVRGSGIDARYRPLQVRLRAGGERLKPDVRRPRRTLKNLFQEAGVPPWQRERLPLLYCGEDLVWVPGLGVEARYRASRRGAGLMPEWRRTL